MTRTTAPPGDPVPPDKEKISISIPRDLLDALDGERRRTGESRSLIIRQLLRKTIGELAGADVRTT